MRHRALTAHACAGLFVCSLTAACTPNPPTTFVGESAHFRLYVDPDLLPLRDAFAGDNALAALETEWSDVETLLHMADGKITYRWYTTAHVVDACGEGEGACTKEEAMEVDAPTLPNAHELNHAYAYLLAQRRPIPLLAEGLAEAIACDGEEQITGDADWRALATELDSAEVESQGGLFVRTVIRKFGIDAFVRYYEQSPERRDPALLGANFAALFGASLDDVWADAHGGTSGSAVIDTRICPCSLPALEPAAPFVSDEARAPYWTLPADMDMGGQTLALTGMAGRSVTIIDCSGATRSPPSGESFLARLDSGAGWFIRGPIEAAAVDRFISDDCASVVPYRQAASPGGWQTFFTRCRPRRRGRPCSSRSMSPPPPRSTTPRGRSAIPARSIKGAASRRPAATRRRCRAPSPCASGPSRFSWTRAAI